MGWPFVMVYLALVLSALYFSFITLPNHLNSQHWPEVTGKVSHTEVIKRKKPKRSGTGKSIMTYAGKIHYQYTVAGEQYQHQQTMLVDHNTDTQIRQAIQHQYPDGATIKVYYNPEDASQSVLEPGLTTEHILIGVFLLGSIGLMAFAVYRNARNRRL